MKPIFFLLVLGFSLLLGLRAKAELLITTTGTFPIPGSFWKLSVSDQGYNLYDAQTWTDAPVPNKPGQTFNGHIEQQQFGKWDSPHGWFVFVDDKRRAWFFGGKDRVYFMTIPKDHNKFIPPAHGVPPPHEFWQRLPPKVQAKIPVHG